MTVPRQLSPQLWVAPQMDPGELRALANAGFRAIVSNRPDGEEPGQPSWAEISAAAKAAGLAACRVPVTSGAIRDEDVARFREALDSLPGPVLAFCRTGTRSAMLWGLSRAGDDPVDEIIRTTAAAGYDLSTLRERLAGPDLPPADEG